ncbi:MAG: extracellular solute-binding protein [Planctomycetota bacterium]
MSASERENTISRAWRGFSRRFSKRTQTERLLGAGAKTSGWEKFANRLAIALLLGTFLLSLAHAMLRSTRTTESGGKEVITLAHWQLEPGVRDGLNFVAEKYNEMRKARGEPEIIFKQLPITEKGYGQWVTTQLMGGTAPDLIEMGLGLPWAVWINYRARYFVPVTQEIMRPNPYNQGAFFMYDGKLTPGEQVPWKETYIDAMGNPIYELQEYYDIGLSTFGCRLFYNAELLKKLTGELAQAGKWPRALDAPPDDLREFLQLCDAIHELKDERGRNYMPIAASGYGCHTMWGQILEPLTGLVQDDVDENMDGWSANDETFFTILQGRVKFDDPRILKVMGLTREVSKRFQQGWKGLSRDDAVGFFIQRRSLFISTGSWDGMYLKAQAETAPVPFEVKIAQYPTVSPKDPEWAELGLGRNSEWRGTAFPFGLTKNCKHPDLVLDFLRFASSQKINEELNRVIGWIPAVQGAKPSEFLAAFAPNIDGPRKGWDLVLGGRTQTIFDQVNPLVQLGQDEKGQPFTEKEWAVRMQNDWIPAAVADFEQRDEVERDFLKSKESTAALLRAKMILGAGTAQGDYYQKRYLGYLGEPVDSPRRIARWQFRLREARQKGLVP